MHDHADELGIDPDRIGIEGISAGGGLAAALALLARDRGEVPVAFQVLDSPMLDDRQVTASSQQSTGCTVWSRDSNEFGWRSYLGDLYGTDDVPCTPRAARATDLSGLPPAIVCVGADRRLPRRGRRLRDPAEPGRRRRPSCTSTRALPHGYQLVADAPAASQCARDIEDWLGRQLASTDG